MSEKLSWEKSLSHALQLAKDQNKMVLVDFYGPL